ncbi:bifunctional B-block binding subunit of TFIIIC/Winged helix DNA-binding domain superfamily [Babesia duncani]|uniref:Bifunctional B-block binding subunit of TFIIIC/Winged helix DNA-binding domain superfamily n=1 Tax=Babesia duncani TaxID=323732 RepID=A0AAD9PKW9_9APIC|nr:bifunctional B-block binding subunit of TFIIIC/Winged helix DNA-binding domain superfamily [Babesia duncani]
MVHLVDEALDILSCQYTAISFGNLCKQIQEENSLCFNLEDRVTLWRRLYDHRDVLIITLDNQISSSGLKSHSKSKRTSLATFINNLDLHALAEFAENTSLLCSNIVRLKRLNLFLYENIVKNYERFRILMYIASKRYKGYWQNDLANDLSISPRNIFTFISSLCKISLIYKLNVPKNRILKHVLQTTLSNDVKNDVGGTEDSNSNQPFVSICFYCKYFVLDRLPEYIKNACFNNVTKEIEDSLMNLLNSAKDGIMLESDWKLAYYHIALKDLNLCSTTHVDQRIISKSYLSFRKSLESRNLIKRMFAWCDQTQGFEVCVRLAYLDAAGKNPVVVASDLSMVPEQTNLVTKPRLYQSCRFLNGRSVMELVYFIIKCNRGIAATEIGDFIPVKYKQLAKYLLNLESAGLVKKETCRAAKVFMYRYHVDAAPGESLEDPVPPVKLENVAESESVPSLVENVAESVPLDMGSQSGELYKLHLDFISKQRNLCRDEVEFKRQFNCIFGKLTPPKHLDTVIFRHRMLLLNNYVKYFQATSINTLAGFFTHVEDSNRRVDRKTVVRLADYTLDMLPHVKLVKCNNIPGIKSTITILYDTTQLDELQAFNKVQEDINKKRNCLMNTIILKSKINKSFKSLNDLQSANETNQDNTEALPLDSPERYVAKNVIVHKIDQPIAVPPNALCYSQRTLSDNGYIFPLVTRTRRLHSMLIEKFSNAQMVIGKQIINAMTLEQYLAIVGCGYQIPNAELLNPKATMDSIDELLYDFLCNAKGKRNCIYLLNRNLTFLARLGLVKMKQMENGTIYWTLVQYIKLDSGQDINIFEYPELYWQHLESMVVTNNPNCTKDFPREIYNKKNWKMMIYLNNSVSNILEKCILLWIRLCCCDMNYKTLMRHLYIPSSITKILLQKFHISQKVLLKFISSKIRILKCKSIHFPKELPFAIDKAVEYQWLGSFALAERCCNSLVYEAVRDSTLAKIDEFQDQSFINKHNIWNYMRIYHKDYTPQECNVIFDAIINRSSLNLRILKRFRDLDPRYIAKFALEEHVPLNFVFNNTCSSLDALEGNVLKSIIFTPLEAEIENDIVSLLNTRTLRQSVSEWIQCGWLIKSKMTMRYKLSSIARLKMFGKFHPLLKKSHMLHLYIGLNVQEQLGYHGNLNTSNVGSPGGGFDAIDIDPVGIDVLIELFGRGKATIREEWANEPIGTKRLKIDLMPSMDGGISRHLHVLANDTREVSAIITRLDNSILLSKDEAMLYSKMSPISRDHFAVSAFSDVLNPLVQIWKTDPKTDSTEPLNLKGILERVALVCNVHSSLDELERHVDELVEKVCRSGSSGILESKFGEMFSNKNLQSATIMAAQALGLVVLLPLESDHLCLFWVHAGGIVCSRGGERPVPCKPDFISQKLWMRHQLPYIRNVSLENMGIVLGSLGRHVPDEMQGLYLQSCKRGYSSFLTNIWGNFNIQFYVFLALRIHDIACQFPACTAQQVCLIEFHYITDLASIVNSRTFGSTNGTVFDTLWLFRDYLLESPRDFST